MFADYRKTKKNIKKIEKTIDIILGLIYNIDKLKRVSEQLKKRTAGTARNAQFVITLLKLTKERSVTILQDSNKKIK
jgi:hypothetical protein